jgi:hypothetical protein
MIQLFASDNNKASHFSTCHQLVWVPEGTQIGNGPSGSYVSNPANHVD